MVPLLVLVAAYHPMTPPVAHPFHPQPCTNRRGRAPTAGIAFEAVKFSANPMSFTVLAFTLAWSSAPIIAQTSLRELDFIQKGPKMKSMKKEKPKLRGVRLSSDALSITRSFQREYPAKELEVLWAGLLKCYGSEELALQAAQDNPQILNRASLTAEPTPCRPGRHLPARSRAAAQPHSTGHSARFAHAQPPTRFATPCSRASGSYSA